MTKKTPEFLNYFLEDCLQGDRQFTKKSMFGGYAIYKKQRIFCIYYNDTIFFKVGKNNIDDYMQYNSKSFQYPKKDGKTGRLSYYELPEDILENREELDIWINKSLKENTI